MEELYIFLIVFLAALLIVTIIFARAMYRQMMRNKAREYELIRHIIALRKVLEERKGIRS